MRIFLLFLIVINTFAATSFRCIYNDDSNNKIKIKGKIGESGGILKIKGSYINGTDEIKVIKVYPYQRKNEDFFKYAKFSNKTVEDFENKKFRSPFYRISIPKSLLAGRTPKRFKGYFGFYFSESPSDNIIEELPELDCRVILL